MIECDGVKRADAGKEKSCVVCGRHGGPGSKQIRSCSRPSTIKTFQRLYGMPDDNMAVHESAFLWRAGGWERSVSLDDGPAYAPKDRFTVVRAGRAGGRYVGSTVNHIRFGPTGPGSVDDDSSISARHSVRPGSFVRTVRQHNCVLRPVRLDNSIFDFPSAYYVRTVRHPCPSWIIWGTSIASLAKRTLGNCLRLFSTPKGQSRNALSLRHDCSSIYITFVLTRLFHFRYYKCVVGTCMGSGRVVDGHCFEATRLHNHYPLIGHRTGSMDVEQFKYILTHRATIEVCDLHTIYNEEAAKYDKSFIHTYIINTLVNRLGYTNDFGGGG